jgi:predicted DNA-binding transcriptional regulator AlpA
MSTTQLEDLITGAEVGRRLGISTERVRQLAGRPDFPPPAGRVGKAVVWKTSDVDEYAAGRRAFFAVNGTSVGIDKARELAARLDRHAGADRDSIAGRIAATIDGLLETGGAIKVTGEEAEVVFGALQKWLEDTNVDVFGEHMMELRYRLFADLQDAGRIPR